MQIADSVVVVTGGASGLGKATALHLHKEGAKVAVLDVNADGGRAVADGLAGSAVFAECDVTSAESVDAALAKAAELGPVRFLVHCAGGGIAKRTLGKDGTPHDLDAFRKVIELNLVGSFNMLSRTAARMATNEPTDDGERGSAVLTASVAGFEGQIGQVAYGSSKAGIIGMTLITARDLAVAGVRVNTIAPGIMGTEIMKSAPEAVLTGLQRSVLFPQRLGHPEEFARLAQHLLENPYMNAQVVRLDGGIRFTPQ
jgi:NAD(P)-dependent dehydrogenase (short-subunit alcohol dehydrogenase family)